MSVIHDVLTLQFASPLLLLAGVPFLIWVFMRYLRIQVVIGRKGIRFGRAWRIPGALIVSDLNTFAVLRPKRPQWRYHIRFVLFIAIVATSTVLLSRPSIESRSTFLEGKPEEAYRTLVVALDISGSMGSPFVKKLNELVPQTPETVFQLDSALPSRFIAMRESLVQFLSGQNFLRVGVVVYSDKPFIYRWPTTDSAKLIFDVANMSLSVRSGPLTTLPKSSPINAQFSLLSYGTQGAVALDAIRERILPKFTEDGKGFAVVFVSDLDDDQAELIGAMDAIVQRGVRLYVFGVDPTARVRDAIAEHFSDKSLVQIFDISSAQEMQKAYDSVKDIERFAFIRETAIVRHDIDRTIGLALGALIVGYIALNYTALARIRR